MWLVAAIEWKMKLSLHDNFADHTIELQMLKKVTDASGFCDVVKAMLALDPKLSKAALLQGIGDAISAPDNLNNLEESVNGAVRTHTPVQLINPV